MARHWVAALAAHDLLVINPQVLNEFAHNVIRKFRHIALEELAIRLEAMRPWCRATVTEISALQALAVHRRFGFSFYDAALIAAALEHGCDLFLSEDLSHGQRVDTLQILDPFRAVPSDFLDFP